MRRLYSQEAKIPFAFGFVDAAQLVVSRTWGWWYEGYSSIECVEKVTTQLIEWAARNMRVWQKFSVTEDELKSVQERWGMFCEL